ncbi:MAG: gliding motility lipoprotein GldH [Bacteroidales bacterium]|nr:gliding motility lipoprotein GldH [Bacteroidales bacterium]
MQNKHTIIFSLLLASLCASCDTQTIYDESLTIPEEAWCSTMPAYFDVEIDDTLTYNTLYLNISNTVNYRYQNIYFFVTVFLPNGQIARDTVNCDLANPYGEWLGKGMGKTKTLQFPYRTHFLFPYTGTYKFYIEQAMRDDTLTGVKAIGLKIARESVCR